MPKRSELPSEIRHEPFSVSEGRRHGVTVKRMLGDDLERPFHGVRVPEGHADALLERCRAYAVRMRAGDFFSHTTAALLWGCPLPERFDRADAPLHIGTLVPNRAAAGQGIIGHRIDPDAVQVVERHGLPVSDAASTWCDLASILVRMGRASRELRGLDDLVAAADHLVLTPRGSSTPDGRPYVDIDGLARRVHSGFHRRGVASARVALGMVRDGAESRPETLVRLALQRRTLPEPVLNEGVFDSAGRFLGRADLRYPEFRVIVEYDGEQHRLEDDQYARDERRIEDFLLEGDLVVRIRKDALPSLGAATLRVERALRSRGWRPPPR